MGFNRETSEVTFTGGAGTHKALINLQYSPIAKDGQPKFYRLPISIYVVVGDIP